jgi:beta-glucanase (GH16 family)
MDSTDIDHYKGTMIPPRLRMTARVALSTAVLAVSLIACTTSPGGQTLTLPAAADTTFTQVPQDGDNSGKTTLATCPASCAGNPAGKRDAFVEFDVRGLPADATRIEAHLRLHTWTAYGDATVTASRASGSARNPGTWADRPSVGAVLDSNTGVVVGRNDWDVSAAVTGNGTVTLALQQQTHGDRLYWASNENSNASLRPQLVVTYRTGGTPTTPTTVGPTTVVPPTTTAPPPGWRLVWSDEFNGTAVDMTKWNARPREHRDVDLACITNRPQNIVVGGGNLTLRAQKETYDCGEVRQYTVGYLDTIHKHWWTYGRFEARIKSPNGPANSKGLWPAFWLRPEDGGQGEIDVVELPGGADWYRRATLAIFRDYTPTKQDTRVDLPSGYPGDGFHTYATEWDADAMVWYIDGVEVWRRDARTTPWYGVFNKPFNLRLNFQVGGWLGNPDAATVFPADFVVDYVRVYQR